jgi:hypothetical protein
MLHGAALPKLVEAMQLGRGVDAISAGGDHTCALKDGAAFCWGAEVGDGSTTQRLVPTAVTGMASDVTAISAGAYHTCAVKDGGAWCWGSNYYGVLGDGSNTSRNVPVAVSGMSSGVTAISAGFYQTCAVKDGGAWCWGYLGGTRSHVPVAVSGMSSGVAAISAGWGLGSGLCAVKDGAAWCWGYTGVIQTAPQLLAGLETSVTAITSSYDEMCAVKDGGAWCWRFDGSTQDATPSAVPSLSSSVSAISAGGGHTCAIKDAGAWCWGFGALGNGSTTGSLTPAAVSGMASGVSAISAGDGHDCAVKDGAVWCWGDNFDGQIGNDSLGRYEVTIGPQQLDCDGDSAKLSIRAANEVFLTPVPVGHSNSYDNPSLGVQLRVTMYAGTVTAPGQTQGAQQVVGETNSAGMFEARLTPTPGTKISAGFSVEANGVSPSQWSPGNTDALPFETNHRPHAPVQVMQQRPGDYDIACPFPDDPTYSIEGRVWTQRNDNGTNSDERALSNVAVALELFCDHCSIIAHTTYSDSTGAFSWSGLPKYDDIDGFWVICFDRADFEIVSINGLPRPPVGAAFSHCALIDLPDFHAGVNELSIEVRPIRAGP